MNIRRSEIVSGGIAVLAFLISIYYYPQMPEKMASHWNAAGQVDGYMSRFWGVFLMPFVLGGLWLLFLAVPRIDPLKANIEKFRKYYDRFIILLLSFMLAVHYWVIIWNLGIKISPNVVLPVGLGLLFFYIGVLCEKAERNWFVGIRTPWTLSSERVWDKTHKLGGKLFKICGAVALGGALFRSYAVYFTVVPVVAVGVFAVVYSYLQYQREIK
jgi:uncharacterized membrane protein